MPISSGGNCLFFWYTNYFCFGRDSQDEPFALAQCWSGFLLVTENFSNCHFISKLYKHTCMYMTDILHLYVIVLCAYKKISSALFDRHNNPSFYCFRDVIRKYIIFGFRVFFYRIANIAYIIIKMLIRPPLTRI